MRRGTFGYEYHGLGSSSTQGLAGVPFLAGMSSPGVGSSRSTGSLLEDKIIPWWTNPDGY